jgi:hypothetical protein
MAIFDDVTLGYGGEEYTVKHDEVMRLIGKVEDVISLAELTRDGGPRLTRLSEAYAVALNYAGCKVTIEDVYASLFGGDGGATAQGAVTGLLMLMLPPATYNPATNGGSASGKKRAGKTA